MELVIEMAGALFQFDGSPRHTCILIREKNKPSAFTTVRFFAFLHNYSPSKLLYIKIETFYDLLVVDLPSTGERSLYGHLCLPEIAFRVELGRHLIAHILFAKIARLSFLCRCGKIDS